MTPDPGHKTSRSLVGHSPPATAAALPRVAHPGRLMLPPDPGESQVHRERELKPDAEYKRVTNSRIPLPLGFEDRTR
jgi:hypothetical protein